MRAVPDSASDGIVPSGVVRFDIQPQIIVPKSPVIRYVRVELLDTATIFRVFWDIFFGLFMTALGAAIAATQAIGRMHRAFLWVTGIAAAAFLLLDIVWMIRARHER